jgi:hypothetical protein
MRYFAYFVVGCLAAPLALVRGEEPRSAPLPVPLTRPEMKQYLEELKSRKPRIPLPELTEEARTRLGARQTDYEARLRYHYLPPTETLAGFGFVRNADPKMSLDYAFKTELFWIVSRVNNCHY